MTLKNFVQRDNDDQIELGTDLTPKFNREGLIPCITVDNGSGDVLMFAWMNEEALKQTLDTRKATYYSRSRKKLWVKGESSGLVQHVQQVLVDCDQDVLQLKVEVDGEGTCHRGYRSCFYRAVADFTSGRLGFIEEPVFDPEVVYKSE